MSIRVRDEDKHSVEINDAFMKVFMPKLGDPVKPSSHCSHSTPERKFDEPTTIANAQHDIDSNTTKIIPDTVLQFQRQLRKTQAAKRASTPLHRSKLQIIHNDNHVVVVNKPSGVLTVPGINSNPSMLTLLHEEYKSDLDEGMEREHMIIHRLDMDTSGVVLYAKTKDAMSKLHSSFREREVSKYYEAVVCGHIHPEVERGSIDLPLQRDHRFPPFMRVATPRSEREAKEVVKDLKNAGWKKIVKKNAKPSQTLFEVMEREYIEVGVDTDTDAIDNDNVDHGEDGIPSKRQKRERFPVTRLKLTPVTGRTHQLRVHCAAIGHPILGDPTYGIYGEASPNGGFEDVVMDDVIPTRAGVDLQLALDQYTKDVGQVMCLHARRLEVKHPESGKDMVFEHTPAF
jgi:tRNA pseudouridine32 synthase/23S rRNA pseudouridine746 synthase